MSSFDDEAKKALPADVRMFSGCKDEQTSADVSNVASFDLPAQSGPKGAGGACTNALLANVYNSTDSFSWIELLTRMQATLKTKGYTQVPQFSGSRQLNLTDKFTLINPSPSASSARKSLFIGINYIGQQGELAGCHNDVFAMQKLLDSFSFSRDDSSQRVLLDDGTHSGPTRHNIIEGMRWLIAGAKPGDTLFMHYSGHGGSIRDTSGDEKDGRDETMCPVDFRSAGQIPDDEIFKELVCPLPAGVTLTVLMDCCHSGSILDLPYTFTASGAAIEAVNTGTQPPVMSQNPGFNIGKILAIGMEAVAAYQRGGASAVAGVAARSVLGAGAGAGVAGAVAARVAGGDTSAVLSRGAKSCIIL